MAKREYYLAVNFAFSDFIRLVVLTSMKISLLAIPTSYHVRCNNPHHFPSPFGNHTPTPLNIFLNKQQRPRIFWKLLLFIFLTFVVNVPLQLSLQAILAEGIVRGYISASFFLVSIITSLYVQARFIEKTSFEKYGLRINRTWIIEFLAGCCIAAVQLMIFYSIMYASENLTIEGYFMMPLGADYSFTAGFLSDAFSLLVGSVGEEVFFRSFLFYLAFETLQHFREPSTRVLLAGVLASLLFGLAHFTNESATILSTANLAIDGMMLAVPFMITGRLGMSIGIHFAWNVLVGNVFGAGVSGNLAKVSLIRILLPDNALTGGAFGPEGSALIILLDSIAVGLIYLWWKASNVYHQLTITRCVSTYVPSDTFKT